MKFNSFHPLVQKVQEWLFLIICHCKSIHFCWGLSHVGKHGNEVADGEVKISAQSADITFNIVPPYDLQGTVRSYALSMWLERLASPLLANNKRNKSNRSHINLLHSAFNSSRRIEIILSRLCIGHTILLIILFLKEAVLQSLLIVTGYSRLSILWYTVLSF